MRVSITWASLLLCVGSPVLAAPTAQVTPSSWQAGATPGQLTVQGIDSTAPASVKAYVTSRAGEQTLVWQYTLTGASSVSLPSAPFATAGFYQLEIDNGATSIQPKNLAVSVVAKPTGRTAGVPFFGINTHFGQRAIDDSAYGLLRLANVDVIRDQWTWPQAEVLKGDFEVPTAPNGGLPHQQQMLLGSGLKILHDCAYGHPGYDGNAFPQSVTAIARFAQYCEFIAQQFGSALYGSEIWNESSSIDAATGYSPLANATVSALKKNAKSAEILQGGGAGPGGGADPIYEQTVYDTIGPGCCTGASVHPYMSNPDVGYLASQARLTNPVSGQSIVNMDFVIFWLDYLSHAVKKSSASNITEIGWYTVEDGGDGVNDEKQAAYTSRALLLATKPSACTYPSGVQSAVISKYCSPSTSATSPDLKSIFIYDFQDDGVSSTNPQYNYGLVHADLTPKMAYSAFAQTAGQLRGSSFYKVFKFDDRSLANAQLYTAGSDGGLLVLWTAEFKPNGLAKSVTDMLYPHEVRTRTLVSITDSSGNAYPSSALQCSEWDGHPCSVDGTSVMVSNLPIYIKIHASLDNIAVVEKARPMSVTNLSVH